MNCPKCNSYNTTVYDSRRDAKDRRKRRRRCVDCGHVFTTYELTLQDLAKLEADAFKGRIQR